MKRGFTLIELLGVITLLGIIAVIAVPVVNSSLNQGKENLTTVQEKQIIKGVKDYFIEHPEKLPTCNSTVEPCISKVCASNKEYELSTFIVSGYLPDKIKNEITGQDYDINSIIIAVRFNKRCDADGNITEKYTYTITK